MRILDLFCGGAGGWSLGMSRAGYRTVAACEIDPWRRTVFAVHHPECRMYADVRDLTAARLMADLGYLPDIIVGSPPCQDISSANTKGRGIDGERSRLFWEAIRLVHEIRPVWLALENSPRLRILGYDALADDLEAAGYACWPLVVGAGDVGANHRRKRAWLIAADATRIGQHGGTEAEARGWPRPKLAGQAAPHANGQGQHGRARDGEMGVGVDGAAVDAQRSERRAKDSQERGEDRQFVLLQRAQGPARAGAAICNDAADADGNGRRLPGGRRFGRDLSDTSDDCGDAADAHGSRYPFRQGFGCDDGAELPSALRDIGLAWPDWNGGLAGLSASCAAAGFGLLDDGRAAGLAPNVRNRAIAALGDAIVPQIAEAIGRSMMALLQTDVVP